MLVTGVFAVAGLLAQTSGTAAIRGQVLDASAGSVAGAGVTLENTATGLRRNTHTDLRGYFTLADLPLTGDVPSQDPSDANLLGRSERATSLLDQRHRAVLSGWLRFARNWNVGTWTSLASGRPFNITTGADNNGDNSIADRPVINAAVIGRNAGRGTPVYDVSTFLERRFPIADHVELTLRAEAFNVLNHQNIVGRNGTYGNDPSGIPLPAFGTPVGGISNVDPGRQFQFTLRMQF